MLISNAIIESLVPRMYATFGSEIAGVLELPLLCVGSEGNMTINGYTFPIIPAQLASGITEHWIAA
jgi:hypothetical protein